MRIFLSIFAFLLLAVISIFGFRGSLSTKPPIQVFPDMDHQAKFKPQSSNSFFIDRRDDRPVPANAVARGTALLSSNVFSADYDHARLDDQVFLTGKNADGSFHDGIPMEVSNALMKQGQLKYEIFCLSCHGAAGDGNGVTKDYGVLAASYHDDRLRGVEDGYLLDVILNGKGLMYGLKERVSPEEGWSIVLYLRALQRSQNASIEDVPAGKRTELGI